MHVNCKLHVRARCCLLSARLNGKNVAFGQVVDGMELIRLMESQGSENGEPKSEVTIESCGVV